MVAGQEDQARLESRTALNAASAIVRLLNPPDLSGFRHRSDGRVWGAASSLWQRRISPPRLVRSLALTHAVLSTRRNRRRHLRLLDSRRGIAAAMLAPLAFMAALVMASAASFAELGTRMPAERQRGLAYVAGGVRSSAQPRASDFSWFGRPSSRPRRSRRPRGLCRGACPSGAVDHPRGASLSRHGSRPSAMISPRFQSVTRRNHDAHRSRRPRADRSSPSASVTGPASSPAFPRSGLPPAIPPPRSE